MDIYVGNLAYKLDDNGLRNLFAEYGAVSSARVVTDKLTGQSKGFGFVDMPNNTEAEAAVRSLNDKDCMGRNLRVNESQPKPEDGERGPVRGGPRGAGRSADRERRW